MSIACAQPLAGNWRSKIKAAKKDGDGVSATEAPAGDAKSSEKPDLAGLSAGLPRGWKALFDKDSGEVYYGNPKTKVGRRSGYDLSAHTTATREMYGANKELEILLCSQSCCTLWLPVVQSLLQKLLRTAAGLWHTARCRQERERDALPRRPIVPRQQGVLRIPGSFFTT